MRLTPKKIEEILVSLIGEEGISLIKELQGKSNISEFDLATKTKKDIKIIRKQLYILYNNNVVSFTRKKDKIKGWYIYYWTLVPESVKYSYFKMNRDLLTHLQEQLEQEKVELFFVCKTSCIRMNFDHAMDFEFRCPECGELVHQDDKQKKVKELEEKIIFVQQELASLQEERKEKRKKIKEKKKEQKAKKKVALKIKKKSTKSDSNKKTPKKITKSKKK
jgi:transcription initiation factor TFIIE subunit alpha